jgi:hypothetical protein
MIMSHGGGQAGIIGRAGRVAQSAKLPDNAPSNPNEVIA